jgi:hypothetical protein
MKMPDDRSGIFVFLNGRTDYSLISVFLWIPVQPKKRVPPALPAFKKWVIISMLYPIFKEAA